MKNFRKKLLRELGIENSKFFGVLQRKPVYEERAG